MNEKKKTKPGLKSTEFYLTLAAAVVGVFLSTGVLTPEQCAQDWCGPALQALGLAAAVLTAFGYTVMRSKVKATDSIVGGTGDEEDPL